MTCKCKDWLPNITILNGIISMHAVHSYGQNGYTGKIFKYCPWCGKKLKEEKVKVKT